MTHINLPEVPDLLQTVGREMAKLARAEGIGMSSIKPYLVKRAGRVLAGTASREFIMALFTAGIDKGLAELPDDPPPQQPRGPR